MDARLRYTRDEIMSSHDYARPHEEAGYRLHGGFTADGTYVSPRTKARWPAVKAWGEALQARGWPLIDATGALLQREGYPTFAQQKLLLQEGFGQTLWNSLTTTGVIEARGQALCNVTAPDMQRLIVEPIDDSATGHMNAGLLYAHGADEGGDPAKPGERAHDAMWFAARDLVFGKDAYPLPEVPASIARPVEDREMPQIPEGYEQLIKFLMNVLMIEIRAESFFSLCCRVFRDPELFTDRRQAAELAATMVERIRTDEAIHVGYLQVLISEMRSWQWRTVDGKVVPGAEIIDPVWARMVEWHGKTERDLAAARTREALKGQIAAVRGEAGAAALLARLDALDARAAA
ncbi:hypothetical protein ACO2Q3_01985 [Caulobacter sp. KR2-114]|uniref:hypothetical protein n=1 Tax=Caulobacter sp. KR2-114 TaxID=3400912 RepID=UPI003C0D58AC